MKLSPNATTYSLDWASDTTISQATFAVWINGEWVLSGEMPELVDRMRKKLFAINAGIMAVGYHWNEKEHGK